MCWRFLPCSPGHCGETFASRAHRNVSSGRLGNSWDVCSRNKTAARPGFPRGYAHQPPHPGLLARNTPSRAGSGLRSISLSPSWWWSPWEPRKGFKAEGNSGYYTLGIIKKVKLGFWGFVHFWNKISKVCGFIPWRSLWSIYLGDWVVGGSHPNKAPQELGGEATWRNPALRALPGCAQGRCTGAF